MHGLSASSIPSHGAAPGQAAPYLTPGQGAGGGNGQVAWQQETAPPPAFAEPFHPVNMARRAMLDQVNPMASVLGAQQLFSMGWPGQQGWGVAPGWNPGSATMMWPSSAEAGYQQQPPPGFGGILNPQSAALNPQSAAAPPAHLGGAGGVQPGLGYMPSQAQAPFLQPGGVLMAAAQFQPGYAGLQHIPGVDASFAGTAVAALPPSEALRLQQLQAQQWQRQQRPTPGTPPLSIPLAPTAVAAANAARKDGAASPEPRPGPAAEAAAAETQPIAGGRPRRSRPRSSKTASEDRVVPEGPLDRAARGTSAKVPTRKQRSAVSAEASGEVADAGAASKSPQEKLKLSQPGRPAVAQPQQQQRVQKRQRRSPVEAALPHEAQAAIAADKPPAQVGRSAAAARRQSDGEEQRDQAAARQLQVQDGVVQQQQQNSTSVTPEPQAAAAAPPAAIANLSGGQGLSSAAATLQRPASAAASQQQLQQLQQQQQQQFALYQQQLLQQQLAQQQQQQQIAAAAMYFQQQQLLQGSYPSSGTPVPTAGGAEPGKDGAAASSPAQRPLQAPQMPQQQVPQMPHPSMQQPQMPNFGALPSSKGYPAANPFMAGFSPVMNPFLALGRGPFDPLMAWYMAHYGTTGLMPDLGFPVVSGQAGGEVMSTPNAQLLARQTSQQHSVRRASGIAPLVPGLPQQPPGRQADAVPSAPARPIQQQAAPARPPARTAVRWWQDPKLTFGPPGDPEFLAKIPDQDRPRPPRPPGENAAVAATCSGPDSGSGEVTSKLRNPGSAETGGMDPSIGGGYALTVAGAAPPDTKPAAVKQKVASPRAAGGGGGVLRQRSCEARPPVAALTKGDGGAPRHVPEDASAPSANGAPGQPCGAKESAVGDAAGPQRRALKAGNKIDRIHDAGSPQRPPDKDKQTNGLLPNGSGGVMTSGQRLLAAQSGASTLDPRPSDD